MATDNLRSEGKFYPIRDLEDGARYVENRDSGELVLGIFDTRSDLRFNFNVGQIARQFGMDEEELVKQIKSLPDASAWIAAAYKQSKMGERTQA